MVRYFTLIPLFALLYTNGVSQLRSSEIVDSTRQFTYLEFRHGQSRGKTPLLIHLHGKRGKAQNNAEGKLKWENNSPIRFLSEAPSVRNKYAMLILAPQLPEKATSWQPEFVNDFINYAIDKYNVDISRIYITGISLGGNGAWKYAYSAVNTPNRIAAIAPIAAWGNTKKGCAVINRNIPTWAFHGKKDQTIEFDRGLNMFNSLKECNESIDSKKYKFTAYENAKHNSWSLAYLTSESTGEQDLYQWLFAQQLKIKPQDEIKVAFDKKSADLKLMAKLPPALKEVSGMILDNQNQLWMHNDSGNGPFLLRYDTTSNTTSLKKITYASNVDWEDITKDNDGNLYIADIGNNDNLRKELFIYKIFSPDTTSSRQSAETISYYYEDQQEFPPPLNQMNFDAEALIYKDDSLYIFTKNRTEPFSGYSKIYKIPSIPGKHKAVLYDSVFIGTGSVLANQVTSASLSKDNEHLALLTYNKIILISCMSNAKFSEGHKIEIPLNAISQKEAICFINDTEVLISDELFRNFIGGNLYKLDLANWLAEPCK